MKAFLAIIFVFIVVISLVYQTGYYSHTEPKTFLAESCKIVNPEPEKQAIEPIQEKPEEKQSEQVKIVYVPQVEKIYIKETYIKEVHYRAESPREVRTSETCQDFTRLAKERCYQYRQTAGSRCDYLQGKIGHYECLKNYGG